MSSFKVPCPSCEAKVLIKNPDLIGKKVECPKCKYRFKVEAPAEAPAAESTPAADKEKDKKPAAATAAGADAGKKDGKVGKKKGGKKGNKKTVGIALGVVGVVLLGVGGVVLFGGSDKKPSTSGGGGGTYSGVSNTGGTGDSTEGSEKGPDKPPPKPVISIPRSDKDTTNLLPGEAVAVYRFDLEKLRYTPLGLPLIDKGMADLFLSSMGFDPVKVEKYYHCAVGEKERAPFGIIRLKEPVAAKDIKIAGAGKAKPVNGHTLYTVTGNPFLTAMKNALAARSLLADVYETPPAAPAGKAKDRPLGACVYDTQHILVGDFAVLDKYLAGLKDGYPEFQTVLKKDTPPPAPPMGPMDGSPMNPAGGPPPMPGAPPMPGTTGGTPPMTPPMPGAPPGTPPMTTPAEGVPPTAPKTPAPKPPVNKDYTSNPHYLSVPGDLKKLLNGLEDDPGGPPMIVMAERFDNAAYPRKGVKKVYEPAVKVIDPVLGKAQYVGLNMTALDQRRFTATVRVVTNTGDEAKEVALNHLAPTLTEAVPVLSLLLDTWVEFRNYADPNQQPPGGSEFPGLPFFSGSPVGSPPMPGAYGPGSGSYPRPGGPGGPPGSSQGMPAMAGGFPRPGGGASYGPPMGSYGPGSYPRPAGPPTGRPVYGMPPTGMDFEGAGMGFAGDPNQPQTQPGFLPSHIDLQLVDNVVSLTVEIDWPEEAYGRVVFPRLFGLMNQVKGKATVFAGNAAWHGLAAAVDKYVKQNHKFPAGAIPRPPTDASRLGLPYPPVQRVSFLAELVPYLGRAELTTGLTPAQAWYDGPNVTAAESWVPEFLVPYYPQTAWRATSPLAPDRVLGGTNYVAVAGVGVDAARYDPTKPDRQKLVGLSGYDWGSEEKEVTDGLANTIYLLQVPPTFSRPWAAGGGATVMGINPTDPMKDFAWDHPDGKGGTKRGTYAIMGDGAVRWLPADIKPADMIALVTRAAGDTLSEGIDKIAPKVNPPGNTSELKTVPKTAEAKPTGGKATDPKAAPPAKSDAPAKETPKAESAPAPKGK